MSLHVLQAHDGASTHALSPGTDLFRSLPLRGELHCTVSSLYLGFVGAHCSGGLGAWDIHVEVELEIESTY